jgi:hypothetical protein
MEFNLSMRCAILALVFTLAIGVCVPRASAQQEISSASLAPPAEASAVLPDAPLPAQQTQPQPAAQGQGSEGKQTKRILGIIPNFRSVSVDEKLPPLSPRAKFKLTIEDSFDYSNFIYVGILAGISQTENSYPEFHHGAPAYARYYWHSFADTLNGNMMTEFIVPTATREDPRYYTLERGSFLKRTGYAVSRLVVARTDSGGTSPNFSEIVGNGAASGISGLYYPSQERTWTKTGQRWVTQVGLDGVSNLVKEFWPDVNSKLFRNKY